MKRIFISLFFTLLLLTLSACIEIEYVNYEDLLLEYQEYVVEQEEIYQLRIDYFNHIATSTIKSVVQVSMNVTKGTSMTGSGVIFYEDTNFYYVLTNNHVIYYEDTGIATYSIKDYIGNEYIGTLLFSRSEYDLAILRIRKKPITLNVISISEMLPNKDDQIAIIGYPSFQVNAISLGLVFNYSKESVNNSNVNIINVDFEIMVTTAPVKSGSSGSVVINNEFELVGIVYAGKFIESDLAIYSFAIPLDKVKEFILLSALFGGDAA
jgi:S1-C subfamily serine protease